MPRVGQTRTVIVFDFSTMKIEVARSAWKVALSTALVQGNTEWTSEGPWKARKASICRKFDSSIRQRVPFVGKTRPAADLDRIVRSAGPGRRNLTKSSFPESSRRALQV
ncbi:hypothetical protein THAOC_21245, partial [Thalassiosira oceanica]